ncbi:hypothetical protein KAR91_41135, partial [Candidatus Pacearchaeota archaeon]|nr:hypothetical protein [Candidatus Pacearchaeota archaeon]
DIYSEFASFGSQQRKKRKLLKAKRLILEEALEKTQFSDAVMAWELTPSLIVVGRMIILDPCLITGNTTGISSIDLSKLTEINTRIFLPSGPKSKSVSDGLPSIRERKQFIKSLKVRRFGSFDPAPSPVCNSHQDE